MTTAPHQAFAAGELDVMPGTEGAGPDGGEEVIRMLLICVGAEDGRAWRERPLRLAFERHCVFRAATQAALDRAGIPWEVAPSALSSRAIDTSVAADLACHVLIDDFDTAELTPVAHGGALPEVGDVAITLYAARTERDPALDRLLDLLRQSCGSLRSSRRPSLSIVAS